MDNCLVITDQQLKQIIFSDGGGRLLRDLLILCEPWSQDSVAIRRRIQCQGLSISLVILHDLIREDGQWVQTDTFEVAINDDFDNLVNSPDPDLIGAYLYERISNACSGL